VRPTTMLRVSSVKKGEGKSRKACLKGKNKGREGRKLSQKKTEGRFGGFGEPKADRQEELAKKKTGMGSAHRKKKGSKSRISRTL